MRGRAMRVRMCVCSCSLTPVSKHMECLSLPKGEHNGLQARWHVVAFDTMANLQPNRLFVGSREDEKCFDSGTAVMDHFSTSCLKAIYPLWGQRPLIVHQVISSF